MQEQAISLDEVDHYGNSAVHVAAQYGHLGCLQVKKSVLFCTITEFLTKALENAA